jgi:hypothetical protein
MVTTKVCPDTSLAAGIRLNIEFSKEGQVSNMKSALPDASSFVETSQDRSRDLSVTVIAPVDAAAPTWDDGLN